MLSCDTFVLPAEANFFGSNLMAKNSDRPIGEAQALTWTDGAEHARGETVRCTYISVPQAEKTYGVLGSKPYWIWGYEMGVNEKGVMIGNEAQGSKVAEGGCENELLGMDLLRFGLERGATAREAMAVITALLEEYGQNANASRLYDKRYENSFFIADREEIWLLETAGCMWAAKRIEEPYAISNCYTIGKPDECSEALEKYARDKGWLAADERFNFAKAYTAPAARQTGLARRGRKIQFRESLHSARRAADRCRAENEAAARPARSRGRAARHRHDKGDTARPLRRHAHRTALRRVVRDLPVHLHARDDLGRQPDSRLNDMPLDGKRRPRHALRILAPMHLRLHPRLLHRRAAAAHERKRRKIRRKFPLVALRAPRDRRIRRL